MTQPEIAVKFKAKKAIALHFFLTPFNHKRCSVFVNANHLPPLAGGAAAPLPRAAGAGVVPRPAAAPPLPAAGAPGFVAAGAAAGVAVLALASAAFCCSCFCRSWYHC